MKYMNELNGKLSHKGCETCKMFHNEMNKRKLELLNLQSNFNAHTKDIKFYKSCECHAFNFYSKQGYNKHIKSVRGK